MEKEPPEIFGQLSTDRGDLANFHRKPGFRFGSGAHEENHTHPRSAVLLTSNDIYL